jgi:nucleoside-triphosphatase THEP1
MEIIESKPLKPVWLKAAVIGSTWASVEIILGSFLHNLKIPFSGTILSFISVWLLISFLQIWKEKGLVLRAGVICALLKSVSPSAFILGPMIGIMSEAVLIELMILIFGNNLIAYLLGGSFAVLSAILHKAVSLLIIYGFNLVKILGDLYSWAAKQVHFEKLKPVDLLILIASIYIVSGMTASIVGYITGLSYVRKRVKTGTNEDVKLQSSRSTLTSSGDQKYSLIILITHIFLITGILLLINSSYLVISVAAACLYLAFCIYYYRNSLKRLMKLSFWISFMIITFAAAFLWNGFSNGAFFTMDGLAVGLRMNARAIIIIIGFAAISTELKNPVIKSLLYGRGLGNVYQSTNLAFSALPFFLSNFSTPGKRKNRIPGTSINSILSSAEALLDILQKANKLRPEVVIITGEIHQGKTTFARRIITELLEQKIRISGFLSLGKDANDIRNGFNLLDIESQKETPLCSTVKDDTKTKLGQYYFNREAILRGNQILNIENLSGKQLIVIDEIGPLEIKGQGWSNSIDNLIASASTPHLWVVRKSVVGKIIRKWNIGNAYVFDITESSFKEVEDKVKEILSRV